MRTEPKKTRRQIQYLRNKIERAAGDRDLRILGCESLETSSAYVKHHTALCQVFETEPPFRQGCLDTTRWVLAASENEQVSTQAALLGVRYLLAELPLCLHAPQVLGEKAVVFIYHQCPDFVATLYRNTERARVSPGQGFGVLQFSNKDEARRHDEKVASVVA